MELKAEEIIEYCNNRNLGYVEFCNKVLVYLAKNYLSGGLDYSYSDGVANNIYDFMISDYYSCILDTLGF